MKVTPFVTHAEHLPTLVKDSQIIFVVDFFEIADCVPN